MVQIKKEKLHIEFICGDKTSHGIKILYLHLWTFDYNVIKKREAH